MSASHHHQQANDLFEQGNAAFLAQDIQTALTLYQQAALLRPDSGLIWQNIAACYQALGQTDAMIQALETAVQRNPHADAARLNLAQAYLASYQLTHAQQHFFALLPNTTYRADAHFGLGVVLMRQGKWYAAQLELAEACQLRPHDVDAMVNLATCFMKQQDLSQAITLLQQVQAIAPDHAIANYRLAALTNTQVPLRAPADYIQALFDHYADYFDNALLSQLHYQVPERLFALWSDIKPSEPIERAYDLGCGTGLMGRLLVPLCQTLIGIDLSSRMLQQASLQQNYQQLILGDIMTVLPSLPPAHLLIAADTFCYFGDLSEVLSLCAKQLQTGGYLLFSTEHVDSGTYILQKNGRYQHSVAYLHHVAEQAGFAWVQHLTATLRQEQGSAVMGDCVALSKL